MAKLRSKRRPKTQLLCLESLEDRCLLTASPDLLLSPEIPTASGQAEMGKVDALADLVTIETHLLSQWDTGATVAVVVRNGSDAPVESWAVAWEMPAQQRITYAWDAAFAFEGDTVMARSETDGAIAPGQAIAFGFNVATGPDGWTEPAFELVELNGEPVSSPDVPPSDPTTPLEDGSTDKPTPSPSPSPVLVEFSIFSTWATGFSANVVLRNPTAEPVTVRDIQWAWPSDYGIDYVWNATITRHQGTNLVATPTEDHKTLAPGEAISFGFNASYLGGSVVTPDFAVNLEGTAPPATEVPPTTPDPSDVTPARNVFLGTQSIGPGYSFTEETSLVETARAIEATGSNILKVALDPTLYGLGSLHQWDPVALLQSNESFQTVLGMDFDYYFFWLERSGPWADNIGISPEEYVNEYEVTYNLATYLLETFEGTGKTFMIGNWETDWNLLEWNPTLADVNDQRVQGLIDWLNLRQDAIDQAKFDFTGDGVEVFHYLEVNRVDDAQELGFERVVNAVLPATNVDFVSYSAYDVILDEGNVGNYDDALGENLSYIESLLISKKGLPFDRRVFIGEFGFYLTDVTPDQRFELTIDVMRAAIDWGTPFVLNWQIYDTAANEGLYLIGPDGNPTRVHDLLVAYASDMNQWASAFAFQHGGEPTEGEIREQALTVLDELREIL
ncbi:Chitinase C precursor [Planctomycetes bacterium Pan216]|uniref:Chitinase C n=1 Tax=Kolteria novifilia TaxID=2527975 RepID=A0A518BA08_9BACT|nr:Chitinase C precursor [Planctomycetes bacterium Pan216]